MKKYFFSAIIFLHFNCLASVFYQGHVQTDRQRFPIFVSKGFMSSSEIVNHFAGKNIRQFTSPGIGTLIIDRTDQDDPILYSTIPVYGGLLVIGTRSSDLQKLFEEKPKILTYHFNHQSLSVVLEDGPCLY